LSAYFEIIKKHFKVGWMYRSNFSLQIVGMFFHYFVMINVWKALYSTNETVNGIHFTQMVTYFIVADLLACFTSSNIIFTIADEVKDGTIGTNLVKPISYKYLQIAQDLGGSVLSSLAITLPVAILMGWIYGFSVTVDPVMLLLFLLSAGMGAMISHTISFLFGILAFWTKTGEYATFLRGACFSLFSGATVPFWFYPEVLRNIASVLPFRFISFEAISIYLGTYSLRDALFILLMQGIWLAVLLFAERILWSGVQKHLVIQGG